MAVVWVVGALLAAPVVVVVFLAHTVPLVWMTQPQRSVAALEARQVMPLPPVIEPAAIIPPPRRELE